VKRRQRMVKPCVSLRDYVPAGAFGLDRPGAAPTRSPRRDLAGSAGVLEQGKGMGRIARKPVRSRTRPRWRRRADGREARKGLVSLLAAARAHDPEEPRGECAQGVRPELLRRRATGGRRSCASGARARSWPSWRPTQHHTTGLRARRPFGAAGRHAAFTVPSTTVAAPACRTFSSGMAPPSR
jgi:hypothetical protein